MKILQRYTRMADREILKLAYDEYAQKVWPRSPAIEPEDIKLILEHLAQTNPKAREINPRRSSTTIWSITLRAPALSSDSINNYGHTPT